MKLVFATHNKNKLEEIKSVLPSSITLLSLDDINCHEDIPETKPTIEENALQKAMYVKEKYGYDCFADDTGLEVEALNNEPGVFSARYAGLQKNDNDNVNKLLQNLENKDNRNARFKTVIALSLENEVISFTGLCKGSITEHKTGSKGFGYDPVFKPENSDKTFAEMEMKEKAIISHRGLAFKQLIAHLNGL